MSKLSIDEVLTRGVQEVLPDKKALAKLMGKKKIKLYQGIDPTASKLHIGHTVGLRKLQQFADLGHEVILLFGTGTVLAGDPSQREEARKKIAAKQIEHNISDWKRQVSPILDFNKINIMYNGEWLLGLKLADIIDIASNISATQLIKRDMFQRRLKKGDTIWMHEVLYPLLQGYDSVAMDVDLEIGGTDQTFNMLIGRELQKKMNDREKYVLTVPMILGTDGQQMSKSSGNCIWLGDTAEDMYGKVMSIPDNQILPYMNLVSNLKRKVIDKTKKDLVSKDFNPMDAKKLLAMDITQQFHGEQKAKDAATNFRSTIQKGEVPSDVKSFKITNESSILDVLVDSELVDSKSEAKRLLSQNAIELFGKKITDPNYKVRVQKNTILKAGKRSFRKLIK